MAKAAPVRRNRVPAPRPEFFTDQGTVNYSAILNYPNYHVPLYLMASYIYSFRPDLTPLISDEQYDRLCKELYRNWEAVTHSGKRFIDKDTLLAGTCFKTADQYPDGIKRLAVEAAIKGENK